MTLLLDVTTATLGLAYILLEWRASAWMWLVGAVMQTLGIVLYFQKGLYADCGMEFYYLAMTAYGAYMWAVYRGKRDGSKHKLAITHAGAKEATVWVVLTLLLWYVIYRLLLLTDSTVPVADSFTTALSVAGMWALAHKKLEQWLIWIVVDVVTCWLYFTKGIPFKASLYALYVVIAIAGYFRWRRLMGSETLDFRF